MTSNRTPNVGYGHDTALGVPDGILWRKTVNKDHF